jgi:Na+/melibiose symporter-like transporter
VRQLWDNRNARLYLSSSVLSTFGDRVLYIAAAIWVRVLTGSNAEAGLTFFFLVLPQLVFSPLAGLLADRLRRRPLLIVSNFLGAGTVMLLTLVRGPGDVWIIYLVMVLYGTLGTVISASGTALMVTVVPSDGLGQANGFLQTLSEGMRLVTPLVGAGIFALLGGAAVAELDAATFLLAPLLLGSMRLHEPRPERRDERWRSETTAGFRHIWGTVELRQILLTMVMVVAVLGFLETAVFAVVTDGLHRPASFVGLMISIQGIGAVAGGVSAAKTMRRIGEARLAALGIAAMAVGSGFLISPAVLRGSLPGLLVGGGAVVLGFGLPWMLVGANTLIQRRTPLRLQGRVDAAFGVLWGGFQTLSIAVGALLIGAVGYVPPVAATTVVGLLAATFLYSRYRSKAADLDELDRSSRRDRESAQLSEHVTRATAE